ncbi:MAG: hypothetical protein QOG00_1956 [Pyrinomonadaceae bacterium]|nr:hypothetical protein [Pyrinomonadaceae bacterium]MDX6269346.1 hypothetical protein [Acidobacteriota bacterium]
MPISLQRFVVLTACIISLTVVIVSTPFGLTVAFAQSTPSPQASGTTQPSGTPEVDADGQPLEGNDVSTTSGRPTAESMPGSLSWYEFRLTIIICCISVVALIMEFFLLMRLQRLKSEDILRVFGVTLIILGTMFFVTVGYNANQVAPAMGLFGTVAGYLLGRSSRTNETVNKE